ncbi:FGGY-family carbohydrate kinase [Roseibium aggregatum]|uniref:FGGY-family carbohydrate kinase n=1 Tax=Roseibium aggregatum TaxID=187304 RepID=UPI001A8DFD7B|nr:FGGY-family carbohydrate kinase [Roseibium aggregatum]MBN8182276.1 FGGY-family carbohydrate kinase [Roseibium aggregatum]UES44100.1 carbohydrate kinase [Roseibium aggregatum]
MAAIRNVGVIDIGKTNAKVAVVDLDQRRELGVLTRPNTVLPGPPYPHFDLEGHWDFICEALAELHKAHGIDALSVTTHGASAVLLDAEGSLAAPMLDYEFTDPDDLAAAYDAIRPDFAETGSPRLGMGLNLGAQLHWQLKTDPGLLDRVATVLTYPQYWTYKLTGVLSNEVTSLGCHTDLWCPSENRFSSLVDRLGLEEKMAPVRKAGDRLGSVLQEVVTRTGLPKDIPVACGIHDSNASLYPHLIRRHPPFSVVSTGTWVIVLAIGGRRLLLDPSRDTLINVNAFGDPVPSARFMGGREFDMILKGREKGCSEEQIDTVLSREIMLFPAVDPRSGPFQGREYHWSVDETLLSDGECFAALSFYLALVTAECLAMTGAEGPIVVEGPFAQNGLYLDMLEAATGRPVEASAGSLTGTSIGAALLVADSDTEKRQQAGPRGNGGERLSRLKRYAGKWQEQLQ